jgi:phosphoglucosamine mutase
VALDGDADRLIAVDHAGNVVDGDHIIAIVANDLRAKGELRNDTVVVTVMTNLGFRLAMGEVGIEVIETAVGDRYVLEALAAGGHSLGGEQSGHVIFSDHATTGDGVLAAVALLDAVHRSGRTLADLAADAMTSLPQVLVNVRVGQRVPDVTERLAADIARVEAELGDHGRVLVRASGTEPLVRVMVEAPTGEAARAAADDLADAAHRHFG